MNTKQKVASANRPAFIKVSEDRQNGIIESIECEYSILIADKSDDDKYFRFYIPAFNIYYFSDIEEDGARMADAAVSTFFDFWIKNQGKIAFFDKIKRLGFVLTTSDLKEKKQMRFSITNTSIPPAYESGNRYSAKKKYSVAA
jgi:hypothetical protein